MGLLLATLVAVPAPVSAAGATLRFGMDLGAVDFLAQQGAKPDYASFWAGAWNEKAGWDYLGANADRLADRGVTPVVQWYYWAGDIGPTCVEGGCWSGAQGVWKSRAQWAADAAELVDALHGGLQGRPGVVVLETEFNKNGVSTWEPFDGYLAEHAKVFRQRAPELRLAVGFGNWAPWDWHRFDRAVAAADFAGLQTMRASTRDSAEKYLATPQAILDATRQLKGLFGKPVLLHDLALSSYWEPEWAGHQERVVRALFARAGDLAAAGLVGIVYRGLTDDPDFTTKEYYGVAERHMGLRQEWGGWKPALDDWVAGVKAVRGGSATAPSGGTFAATFTPKAVGNDWWVETRVTANQALAKVEVSRNAGPWEALDKQWWGDWAKSLHAPDGTAVRFRAWSTGGASAVSGVVTWGGTVTSGFQATFEPRAVGNDWWVEAKVTANQALTKVDGRVDGGAWQALAKTSWDTWAKSIHAPGGAQVQFRAWSNGGASDLSATVTWT